MSMNTGSYNDSLGGGYAAGANPNAVLMHDDGGFEREVSAPSSAGAHPNQRSHWHSGRNGEMERAFSVIASVGNTAVSSSRQSGDGGLFSVAALERVGHSTSEGLHSLSWTDPQAFLFGRNLPSDPSAGTGFRAGLFGPRAVAALGQGYTDSLFAPHPPSLPTWDPSSSLLAQLSQAVRRRQQHDETEEQLRSLQRVSALDRPVIPTLSAVYNANLPPPVMQPQVSYGSMLSSNSNRSPWNCYPLESGSKAAFTNMMTPRAATAPVLPSFLTSSGFIGAIAAEENTRSSDPQQPASSPSLPRVKLPKVVSHPLDGTVLSDHQKYLREQMEVFQATEADCRTPVPGRNKRIHEGQVGIRCRHCVHLPIKRRQLGSVYFPMSMLGFYQAAQNMCSTHLQCGKCSELSDEVKGEFVRLLTLKNVTSNAGRRYWAEQLCQLGLVDTDKGVFLFRDLPSDVEMIPMGSGRSGKRCQAASKSMPKLKRD